MIDIDKLTNQISATIDCSVKFGDEDVSPSEYPIIKLIPDNDIDFFVFTSKGMSITITFTLKIIVARENERQAFFIFYDLMKSINGIDPAIGLLTSDKRTLEDRSGLVSTEYTDNEYTLSIPLQYKDIINKEI